MSESGSVVSDSLRPHGLYNPWNSPGQNTGVSRLSLLQGIFSTQGSNPGLLHCRQIPYQLSLELTPQNDVLFIIRDWNAKVGSQETPGVTANFGIGGWNEAGQRLIEFCQENALVIANTLFQQHKRTLHVDITRWSTPKSDCLYSLQPKMEKLYTVSKNKTGS